jgi:hypothetical protein
MAIGAVRIQKGAARIPKGTARLRAPGLPFLTLKSSEMPQGVSPFEDGP